MESKDILPEFQDFLVARNLVPKNRTRFYAYWVRRFLGYFNQQPLSDIDALVAAFLDALSGKEKVEDWRVQQAEDALRLYLDKGNSLAAHPINFSQPAGVEAKTRLVYGYGVHSAAFGRNQTPRSDMPLNQGKSMPLAHSPVPFWTGRVHSRTQRSLRKADLFRCRALGRLLRCTACDPARCRYSQASGGKERLLRGLCGLKRAYVSGREMVVT